LRFSNGPGRRKLSFGKSNDNPALWKEKCTEKLKECLGIQLPARFDDVKEIRELRLENFVLSAFVMQVDENLSIPAYLCVPDEPIDPHRAVIAIHGHGEVEPLLGQWDDYHHSFAIALANAGHFVLCPELRGFGTLYQIGQHRSGSRLDYWKWGNPMSFSLATDAFQHGSTMLGRTIEDLLRWEQWLHKTCAIDKIDVAGISYGGDLAITYPVFSDRVDRIFASGTLGSFSAIFEQAVNAPAHCIPDILNWMDRSDIAGLNAPRPILLH
jgi:cephalosporin-C deacetylase-like acetyl esterase